jgi:hypothetical protein
VVPGCVEAAAPAIPAANMQNAGGVPPGVEDEGYMSPPDLDQMTPPSRAAATLSIDAASQSRTPPSENLDADHDEDVSLRYRNLSEIIGLGTPPGQVARGVQLLLVAGEEPTSFKQAEQDASWRRAMMDEINSIEENHT